MSHPPQPGVDPDRIAQLQQQLDAAQGQVARVQAELSATGSTASTAPFIVVNGQTIHVGDDHQPTTIADALRASQTGTPGAAPMVFVGGQQVATGQPFSLAQYLDSSQLSKVQLALGQLTQTHPDYAQHFQGLLGSSGQADGGGLYGSPVDSSGGGGAGGWGAVGPTEYPSAASVAALAQPPRAVPVTFRLATFNLSLLEFFVLALGAAAPIALWVLVPYAGAVGLVVGSAMIIAYRVHLYVGRTSMLRWGKVATVTHVELLGAGSYYGGATYQNMRMRQANGWQAKTEFYSGPGYRNKISYDLDGTRGDVVLHGRDYDRGVVLANSRKPSRAMCVSAFPYDVEPTSDGQWPGRLTAWLWVGIVLTVVVELGWFYLTALAAVRTWGG